jgi:hypothetical protein
MYFQNPFVEEFRGSLPFADRQYSLDFVCPRNAGREKEAVWTWTPEPYNFTKNTSGNNVDQTGNSATVLTLAWSFCQGGQFKTWVVYPIDIQAKIAALNNNTGAYTQAILSPNFSQNPAQQPQPPTSPVSVPSSGVISSPNAYPNTYNPPFPSLTHTYPITQSAVLASEVCMALMSDTTFSTFFTAKPAPMQNGLNGIQIRQTQKDSSFRFYVVNGGADEILNFNARCGIAQLPEYFNRHTIANVNSFTDSVGQLVCLTPLIYSNASGTPAIQTGSPAIISTIINITYTAANNNGLASGSLVAVKGSDSSPSIDASYSAGVPTAQTVSASNLTANTFSLTGVNVGTTAGTHGYWATMSSVRLIDNAVNPQGQSLGYTLGTVTNNGVYVSGLLEDYQLISGKVGTFTFQNITPDSSAATGVFRPYTIIEYPAGAVVGSIALKTIYLYQNTTDTNPVYTYQVPHVMKSVDFVSFTSTLYPTATPTIS